VYVSMYVCMYVDVFICIYIYTYIHIYIYDIYLISIATHFGRLFVCLVDMNGKQSVIALTVWFKYFGTEDISVAEVAFY